MKKSNVINLSITLALLWCTLPALCMNERDHRGLSVTPQKHQSQKKVISPEERFDALANGLKTSMYCPEEEAHIFLFLDSTYRRNQYYKISEKEKNILQLHIKIYKKEKERYYSNMLSSCMCMPPAIQIKMLEEKTNKQVRAVSLRYADIKGIDKTLDPLCVIMVLERQKVRDLLGIVELSPNNFLEETRRTRIKIQDSQTLYAQSVPERFYNEDKRKVYFDCWAIKEISTNCSSTFPKNIRNYIARLDFSFKIPVKFNFPDEKFIYNILSLLTPKKDHSIKFRNGISFTMIKYIYKNNENISKCKAENSKKYYDKSKKTKFYRDYCLYSFSSDCSYKLPMQDPQEITSVGKVCIALDLEAMNLHHSRVSMNSAGWVEIKKAQEFFPPFF